MINNGIMYHSKTYSRQCETSDDRIVRLEDGSCGRIERIFHFERNVNVILTRSTIARNALNTRGENVFSFVDFL